MLQMIVLCVTQQKLTQTEEIPRQAVFIQVVVGQI